MKKIFFYLLCAAAVPTFFASCSDDDEGGSMKASATVITTSDGDKVQVTRVGDNYYGYDDDGVLNYLYWNGNEYDVSGNGTKLSLDDDYYYTETIEFSYNGSGYVSKCTQKYSEELSDGESYSGSSTASYSYDGSGHLTKISYTGSETEVYDGDKDSLSYSGSITLTWSNGLLTKYVHYEKENGGWGYTETFEFDYNDGQYPNLYNQFAPAALGWDDDIPFAFFYIGLNGKGPNYLPTTAYWSWVEDDGDGETSDGSGSSSYKYGFNRDGTIAYQCTSEGEDEWYDYFEYDDYGSASAKSNAAGVTTSSESLTPTRTAHRSMFSKLANRRHQARAAAAE